MFFSVIIPVYNRPEEVEELLDSLTLQSERDSMEVIVVEDGSAVTCKKVVEKFSNQLNITYLYQENKGPGKARNYGASIAKGKYLLFFDSDCVLPSDFMHQTKLHLEKEPLECFGGPDKAHKFFTRVQQAISYSMTSFLTTGGIRGGKKKMDKFYPRSFNMGVQRSVFEEIGGFGSMRYGEDIDFSMNVVEYGYKVGLISETFVYHKRRNTFKSFYKQVFCSGTARVTLALRHSGALKLVHLLPSAFVVAIPTTIVLGVVYNPLFFFVVPFWLFMLIADGMVKTESFRTGLLCAVAGFIQIGGYGLGFITALTRRLFGKEKGHVYFKTTFYK